MLLRYRSARLAIGASCALIGLVSSAHAAAPLRPAAPIAHAVPGMGPVLAPLPRAAGFARFARVAPVRPTGPRHRDAQRTRPQRVDHIELTEASAARFLPLYRRASGAFGVSWRLIASIHQQETSFSSARGTYRGLNFAGCCGGPMQFNVTNGPVSTWERFRGAFRRAERPARYPHRTRRHPSLYDDFDAIMAAGALLRESGAGARLDGAAWLASYHYYGHDLTGLLYADQVLARAAGWARRGLCVQCPVDAGLVSSFDAAFARQYRAQLLAAERLARKHARARERARRAHAKAVVGAKRRAAKADAAKREAAKREAAKRAATKREAAKRTAAKREAAAVASPKPKLAERPVTPAPAAPPPSGGQAAS
jgi:hypothetical protein